MFYGGRGVFCESVLFIILCAYTMWRIVICKIRYVLFSHLCWRVWRLCSYCIVYVLWCPAYFQLLDSGCSHFMFLSLWASGQNFWLQIKRSVLGYQRYQIFWEVVGLERDPLSLVSTIEELLERKSSGSGLESREYCHRDPSRWPCSTHYP
jgi:hypothetical protein